MSPQLATDLRQDGIGPGLLRDPSNQLLLGFAINECASLISPARFFEVQQETFATRAHNCADMPPLAGFDVVACVQVDREVEVLQHRLFRWCRPGIANRREPA